MPVLTRRRVAAVLLLLALLGACASGPPPAPPRSALPTGSLPAPDLLAALREGGLVVYLRHAATDTTIDAVGGGEGEGCAAERNLTIRGREQAERIGEGFRAGEIPVAEVRASPTCRTSDTATLAFGDRVEEDPLLLPADDPGAADDRTAALRRLLTAPVPAGNRVLVGHLSNIAAVADVPLAEGEAAVFSPVRDGEPVLLGTILEDGWAP